jgi:hypothetical protein
MEIVLIELLLWVGLIFFFWALRDGLSHVDAETESQGGGGAIVSQNAVALCFDRPDKVSDPIGRYRDVPIYRYAVISGKKYQFEHILPWESFSMMLPEERCLAPGLVYGRDDNAS